MSEMSLYLSNRHKKLAIIGCFSLCFTSKQKSPTNTHRNVLISSQHTPGHELVSCDTPRNEDLYRVHLLLFTSQQFYLQRQDFHHPVLDSAWLVGRITIQNAELLHCKSQQ